MRLISLKNISPDMMLAKPVYYNERILLNKGIKDIGRYKKRLEQLGINYIYVEDEISKDIELNDVIEAETRNKCKKVIRETMEEISFNREVNIKKVKDAVDDIINDLLANNDVMANMFDIKDYDSYTFAHSVNVAVIALFMGKFLQYNRERLFDLGLGAILHDIGKILLPQEIINKPDKLTAEELEHVKEHTKLGYDYLKGNREVSSVSRIIVLLHHERLDGSGYPKGLKGDDIHDFAKIVAIADVFDALTSDRIYRPRWSIQKAVDYIMSNIGSMFEFEFVDVFVRNIAVYPNGTLVTLSNGKKGIVKEQNVGSPTRPIIKIIEDENGDRVEDGELINLMDELDIVVSDI